MRGKVFVHPPRKLISPLHDLRLVLAILFTGLFSTALPLSALQVTGYSAAQNDRYSSGFPTAPVLNGDPFYLGKDYDWSGTAWSTQTHAAGSYKGFAMLSPRHFLTAQHYEYSNNNEATTGVRVLGRDGLVYSANFAAPVSNLGFGLLLTNYDITNYDLAVGTLTQVPTVPANVYRTPLLDLNASSSSNSLGSYTSLALIACGRSSTTNGSPRVGAVTPELVTTFNSDLKQAGIRTLRDAAQLEAGDSGSPAYHGWTNPNGGKELALLGLNSAADATYSYMSFLPTAGAINAANAVMVPDGYALRVVGNPAYTWAGGSGSNANLRDNISRTGNWSPAPFVFPPSDVFVLLNAASTSYRSPEVDANSNFRGVYFRSTVASGDGFNFTGTGTLTIGRGGITNYDNDPQAFTAPLALGDHQYWDAGPGGLNLANLNTNGKLLEIQTGGTTTISGNISGNGSLALDSGLLVLSGDSSFTGTTWVHGSTLRVTGSVSASSAIKLAGSAILEGHGTSASAQGSGTVSPGPAARILTMPSVDPASGLDFAFEFGAASAPAFGSASASTNDVMRLSGVTPFSAPLGPTNKVSVYLDVPSFAAGQVFQGGFFTDQPADFSTSVQNAAFEIFLADPAGAVEFGGKSYSAYAGPLVISVSTATASAGFSGGTVNGRVLQLEVLPDPASYAGWAQGSFPEGTPLADREPDADPNHDGVSNFLAWALRLDPINTPPEKLPKATFDVLANELVFQFRRNKSASGLIYEVYSSTDLSTWTLLATTPSIVNADPDGDGSAELVEIRIPAQPGESRIFARLRTVIP